MPVSFAQGQSTYEGASIQSRRTYKWVVPTAGPNDAVIRELSILRARSRALVRNTDIGAAAIDTWVSNLVGTGINPRWNLGSEKLKLKQKLQDLWNAWVEEADYDGIQDFYGLQMLVAREMIEAGECFAILRFRPADSGLTVPLQIQVIEPDLVDEAYNILTETGEIKSSIEFDGEGRRVAYWIYQKHPAEFSLRNSSNQRVRFPADVVAHVYRPLRAGQIRGIPWFAPILIRLYELDQYEDAELVRKKTAAMFGGFIIEGGDPASLGYSLGNDSLSREIVALEPGSFPVLPPGTDVRFSTPADVGANYEIWIKQQLRHIAKGLGLTYEQLTGDLSDVNYSSIRAGLLEFRRLCRQHQLRLLVHQFCRVVIRAWMDTAVLSGAINIGYYWEHRNRYLDITWHPDGWDWVDPQKDIDAEIKAIRAGLKSRAQSVSERGRDIEEIDREQMEDRQRMTEMGMNYDSDPNKEI